LGWNSLVKAVVPVFVRRGEGRGCRSSPLVPVVARPGAFPGLVVAGHDCPAWRLRVLARADHLMLLDFDPAVKAVASQSFWLHWEDGHRGRRHAPDFFVRLADGTGVVIGVRADDRIERQDVEAFDVTARACEVAAGSSAGWARSTRFLRRTCAGCRATGIPGAQAPRGDGCPAAGVRRACVAAGRRG
jgi:hypothetical protein